MLVLMTLFLEGISSGLLKIDRVANMPGRRRRLVNEILVAFNDRTTHLLIAASWDCLKLVGTV